MRSLATLGEASAALEADKRWPHDLTVPKKAGLSKYISGERTPEAMQLWACAKCMGFSVDWLVTGDGSAIAAGEQPAIEFETELARRVLDAMPVEGSLAQSIKVSGAACLAAAIDVARQEWEAVHKRVTFHGTLREADHAARHFFTSLHANRPAVGDREYQRLREALAAIGDVLDEKEVRLLRAYPEPSDYTELSYLPEVTAAVPDFLIPASKRESGTPQMIVAAQEEYGYRAKCPLGYATRGADGAWTALPEPQRKTVKRKYLKTR